MAWTCRIRPRICAIHRFYGPLGTLDLLRTLDPISFACVCVCELKREKEREEEKDVWVKHVWSFSFVHIAFAHWMARMSWLLFSLSVKDESPQAHLRAPSVISITIQLDSNSGCVAATLIMDCRRKREREEERDMGHHRWGEWLMSQFL